MQTTLPLIRELVKLLAPAASKQAVAASKTLWLMKLFSISQRAASEPRIIAVVAAVGIAIRPRILLFVKRSPDEILAVVPIVKIETKFKRVELSKNAQLSTAKSVATCAFA